LLNEVGSHFGILTYVCDIVVKGSGSLSHLVMSSMARRWALHRFLVLCEKLLVRTTIMLCYCRCESSVYNNFTGYVLWSCQHSVGLAVVVKDNKPIACLLVFASPPEVVRNLFVCLYICLHANLRNRTFATIHECVGQTDRRTAVSFYSQWPIVLHDQIQQQQWYQYAL